MQIVTVFDPLTGLTASGSDAEFPAANLQQFEPWRRWWADAYDADAWLLVDRGAGAGSIDSAFLGNANFPSCRLQAHATNAWESPSVDILAAPVVDNLGNRKGFFSLGTISHRYLRLLIPVGQTLDAGEAAVPALGVLALGLAGSFPTVQKIGVKTLRPFSRGVTVSGRLRKWRVGAGVGRHVITIPQGDDWAAIRDFSLNWDLAVIAADLGSVGDAWLVYGADEDSRNAAWLEDADASITLEEVA